MDFDTEIFLRSDLIAPILFPKNIDVGNIDKFLEQGKVSKIINLFDEGLKEAELAFPDIKNFDFNWIYLPWSKELIKNLSEEIFLKLRTFRNKNLITEKEQDIFYNFKVGLAGLSVGNSIATSLILHGGGKKLRIIDNDIISFSNLNRLCAPFSLVGVKKIKFTQQSLYSINPYIQITSFDSRVTLENISEVFPAFDVDVIVDEIDDLKTKILLREYAKKMRLPVLMATDNGDSVIIDCERFDLDPDMPLLHGILTVKEIDQIKNTALTKEDYIFFGKKIVGIENISSRMEASLEMVGKELKSVPQLSTATIAAGAFLAKIIRDISLKTTSDSFRKIIDI